MTKATTLEMKGIRKAFGNVVALDDVHLQISEREIHGLLGGNGAGKTTLMNVLFGLYKPDAGTIQYAGQPLAIQSPRDAINQGIGMVHQHFLQVNNFTVTENIVLGTRAKGGFGLDLAEAAKEITALSQKFGLEVDPGAIVEELPMGTRQRVEILKALYRGAKILILDEPTTSLTPQEVDSLFASLRVMVKEGLSVIFITHKLREVLSVCDRISVLHQGRNALTLDRENAAEEAFIKAMVGDELDIEESVIFSKAGLEPRIAQVGSKPVLQVRDVSAVNEAGIPVLEGCSLKIVEGEILGIAGVAGNGQRELAEAILGIRPITAGAVSIDGSDVSGSSTGELLSTSTSYVPEDRLADGFLPTAKVSHNLILGQHRKPPYSNGRFLNLKAIAGSSQKLIDSFNIKAQGPDDVGANLSGGNIQRVMLARAFAQPRKLMIVHNPTQGLDIPSTEAIYSLLLDRKQEGMATLLISEDIDELFLLCNRIAVIFSGRLVGVLSRDKFDKYALGGMMSGVNAGE